MLSRRPLFGSLRNPLFVGLLQTSLVTEGGQPAHLSVGRHSGTWNTMHGLAMRDKCNTVIHSEATEWAALELTVGGPDDRWKGLT